MVLLAFSLQDQVEKYGAYIGIGAFFGLAILTLLYFAQAREVKRLREWAGRAPERVAELDGLIEEAHAVLQAPAPAPAAVPVAQAAPVPEPAVAANGAVKLAPAELAALAFARAAGVHTPHEPKPHPVPAAAPAAAPVAQAVATAPAPTPAPAPAPAPPPAATNGDAAGAPPPPPLTPAARRAEPKPLPPRRSAPPSRRTPPPPRRESNTRAVVLTAVIGVLVLGAVAFAISALVGGDETPPSGNRVVTPTPEASAEPTTAAAPTKANTRVVVLNGTGQTGLAARIRSQLVEEGYPDGNLGTGDVPEAQQRQTSIVMYAGDAKPAADEVATALDIPEVAELDPETQALPALAGKDFSVVVIAGVDKS